MNDNDELLFVPLGGCGEVGMNLYCYGIGAPGRHEWIITDIGVKFGDDSIPGIDVLMADPAFIRERKDRLRGIILTHGHEDHIGAIAHLWPQLECPVYVTPFTRELIRDKIGEAGLEDVIPINVVPLGGTFDVGPFSVELVTMTHSIPEPNAVVLRTKLGTLLHTGDWKLDPEPVLGQPSDEAALRRLGDEGVVAMICDSTNALTPGHSGSEAAVRDALIDLLHGIMGRVALTTFASNAARLDSIGRAARASGREVVLVGRSMHRTMRAARACGYLNDFPTIVQEDEAGFLPPERVLYLCTGSQGEARAALARIAEDTHPNLSLGQGDTVIFSSKIIPGNEKVIFALQNRLAERGIEVITEKDRFVHVSGHPCRDELAKMYEWVRPKTVVPMHGEGRMLLEHAQFAKANGIEHTQVVTNGHLIRLAPGTPEIIDEVHHGRVFLDGKVLTPEDSPALAMRRRVAHDGAIIVMVVLDPRGDLLDDPTVVTLGVPEELAELDSSLEEDLSIRIENAIERMNSRARADDGTIDEEIRRTIRRMMRFDWGKRPFIDVRISRFDEEEG